MDDTLEQPNPSSSLNTSSTRDEEDREQDSSGDEDGGLDWTKLPTRSGAARPVIPKRGEKDFEPTQGGGSGLQRHNLESARSAMFDVLRSTRTISSKSVSYAVWYPNLARAHVTVARGVHFTSMGHSAQRPASSSSPSTASGKSLKKRLELLPEETLYLVEKGALFCWKASCDDGPGEDVVDWDSSSQGAPMSVQQSYAEMIGTQDLTLDRYQTFAYLRRLGYIVTRAKPPSPAYPAPAPYPSLHQSPTASIFRRVFVALCSPVRRFLSWLVQPSTTWWRPLVHRRWLHHNMDYRTRHFILYTTLRFMPAGHSVPLQSQSRKSTTDDNNNKPSPYEIFYHLHKPNTPYRKTAPPPPDFSIVVVNARTTPMPTLAELTHMYEGLPVLPPPLPRKRNPPSEKAVPVPKPSLPKGHNTASRPSFVARLLSYLSLYSSPPTPGPAPVKINPFVALRQGNKSVIIAVVDAGTVSFFKFGQGAFEEWPMVA